MNYTELIQSTKKLDSDRINPVSLNLITLLSSEDNLKGHLYACEVKSETGKGIYNTFVQYLAVEENAAAPKKENPKEIDIEVSCSCIDYRFIFAYSNLKHNCLYGPKPPEYEKKTDRPLKNPKELVGLCKHLQGTFDFLFKKVILL